MMVEDRGKDEFSAQNLMKKHEALEAAVEDYRDNVRQLGEVARQLASEGNYKIDNYIIIIGNNFIIFPKDIHNLNPLVSDYPKWRNSMLV